MMFPLYKRLSFPHRVVRSVGGHNNILSAINLLGDVAILIAFIVVVNQMVRYHHNASEGNSTDWNQTSNDSNSFNGTDVRDTDNRYELIDFLAFTMFVLFRLGKIAPEFFIKVFALFILIS